MIRKNTMIAFLLLIAGMSIYGICRQEVLFLVPFKEAKLLELIKLDIKYSGNIFVYFLIFCLPDIFWYLALLLLQIQFYNGSPVSKILFGLAVVLPFVLELLQFLNVIYGTFDFIDLIFYLLTFLIFTLWQREKLFYKQE